MIILAKKEPLNSEKDENKLSDLSKRFLLALEIVDYSAYRLAKEVDDINQQTFVNIRSGRNLPSTKVIRAFVTKFPTINTHWIFTGKGDPVMKPLAHEVIDETSPYVDILHKIPIDDIVNYMENHEVSRGFNKSDTYKLFLEVRTQLKLMEKMNALEERVENLFRGKGDAGDDKRNDPHS